MATVPITGGPVKDELVSQMLSNLPVTFWTASGSTEVLIEEMQEADLSGNRLTFSGRSIADATMGRRLRGHYDCLQNSGMMEISLDGA